MAYRIQIDITADGKAAVKTFDEVGKASDRASQKTRESTKPTQDATKALDAQAKAGQKLAASLAGVAEPLLVLGGGAGLIALAATRAVTAFAAFEAQQMRVANMLRATASASGQTSASIEALSQKLGDYGTHTIDQTRAAAAELIKFRDIGGDVFARVVRGAQDLSNTWGLDLPAATQVLAAALKDPIANIDALRAANIKITPQQEQMIAALYRSGQAAKAYNEILKIVEQQVGGATQRASESLSAAFGRLTAASGRAVEKWGEQAAGGAKLVTVLDKITSLAERLANVPFGKFFDFSGVTFPAIPDWLVKLANYQTAIPDFMSKPGAALGGANPITGGLPDSIAKPIDGAVAKVSAWFSPKEGYLPSELDRLNRLYGKDFAPAASPAADAPTPRPATPATRITVTPSDNLTEGQALAVGKANAELEKQARLYGLNERARASLTLQLAAGIDAEKSQSKAMREAAQAIDQRTNAMLAAQFMRGYTDQTQLQTAALKVEADTMFMAAGQAAAYKNEQDALARARQSGITLSEAQIATIKGEAAAYGEATQRVANLRDVQGSLSGSASDFRQLIAQGATAWGAFEKAGLNALGRLADKMLDRAFTNFFGNMFGGLFGSVGIGSLLPTTNFGFGGPTAGINFDRGGYTGPGGKREPAGVVHRGEVVWSQDDVRRAGGVATVEALRLGSLRGYADGGAVASSVDPGAAVKELLLRIVGVAAAGVAPKQNQAAQQILDWLPKIFSGVLAAVGAAKPGAAGGVDVPRQALGIAEIARDRRDRAGYTGAGAREQPAGIVHRGEVVWSQDDVRRAGGVANVEALRLGSLRGYASGGPVAIPPPPTRPMSRTDASAGGVTINGGTTHITVQGNADNKTLEAMHAELARRDARFFDDVVAAVRSAQSRNYKLA